MVSRMGRVVNMLERGGIMLDCMGMGLCENWRWLVLEFTVFVEESHCYFKGICNTCEVGGSVTSSGISASSLGIESMSIYQWCYWCFNNFPYRRFDDSPGREEKIYMVAKCIILSLRMKKWTFLDTLHTKNSYSTSSFLHITFSHLYHGRITESLRFITNCGCYCMFNHVVSIFDYLFVGPFGHFLGLSVFRHPTGELPQWTQLGSIDVDRESFLACLGSIEMERAV